MKTNSRIHVKNCFGCDPDNPIGLKAVFFSEKNSVSGYFQSNRNHQGPPGYVHGGIIAAFFDEGCSYFVRKLIGTDMLTIRNEIRFKAPAVLGDKIFIDVRIKNEKSRTVTLSANVTSNDKITAVGESTIMKIPTQG